MPAGNPQAYIAQGMSPAAAYAKAYNKNYIGGQMGAGVTGGSMGGGGPMTGVPPKTPPNMPNTPGAMGVTGPPKVSRPPGQDSGVMEQVIQMIDRVLAIAKQGGVEGAVVQYIQSKVGGGMKSPVGPKAVAGGDRPMGGAPSGMLGGPVPKPGGMAGGPPKMGMM
mgnify:FL=1